MDSEVCNVKTIQMPPNTITLFYTGSAWFTVFSWLGNWLTRFSQFYCSRHYYYFYCITAFKCFSLSWPHADNGALEHLPKWIVYIVLTEEINKHPLGCFSLVVFKLLRTHRVMLTCGQQVAALHGSGSVFSPASWGTWSGHSFGPLQCQKKNKSGSLLMVHTEIYSLHCFIGPTEDSVLRETDFSKVKCKSKDFLKQMH